MPLAVFLVGSEGSGRSTLRNYLNLSEIQTNIDPDLLNRIFKAKYPKNYQIEAAKQALQMHDFALKNNLNICIKSSLSGRGTIQRINDAKKLGYYVIAYFVGLNNVELNLARVAKRAANGGHNIPENIVRRRYTESINNLLLIIKQFNQVFVLDNSSEYFQLGFAINNNQLTTYNNNAWTSSLLSRFQNLKNNE